MITLYNFEDKNEESLIKKCEDELGVSIQDLIIEKSESESGLFKSKKYLLTAIKKEDIKNEIKSFISDLSKGLNIEINAEIREGENGLNVMLVSNNNAILIGKDGKNLSAIQLILSQYINKQVGKNLKINVDIANYKEKKEKNFEYEIKKICREVENTKVDVKLDSMNSYNRRIVHNIVSTFEHLESHSEGEEPNRFTIITYKED